jgi:hypothetical protein
MKKTLVIGSLCTILLCFGSCSDNQSEQGTHTHNDGSTHADHDTTKPKQEEFKVTDSSQKDSTPKEHTHADGEKHTH